VRASGIVVGMKTSLALAAIVAAIWFTAAVRTDAARAAWCWPACPSSSYGVLAWDTSTHNGCWYSAGAVCSGWNYWTLNGVDKRCWPICSGNYTHALILYGFENRSTIRGRFADYASIYHIRPADVSMGGYLRAQVNWWPYTDGRTSYASLVHVEAV
jgi:hypothetical protein